MVGKLCKVKNWNGVLEVSSKCYELFQDVTSDEFCRKMMYIWRVEVNIIFNKQPMCIP